MNCNKKDVYYQSNNITYNYATQEIKDIILNNLDITDLLVDTPKYNNYYCPDCGKSALRVYQSNLAYCHSCKETYDYLRLYCTINNISLYVSILQIFADRYKIKLNKDDLDLPNTPKSIIQEHYYIRHLKLYTYYYNISKLHDIIGEHKSHLSYYLNFKKKNLTHKQLYRIIGKIRDTIPMYELDYLALILNYNIKYKRITLPIIYTYLKCHCAGSIKHIVENNKISYATFRRAINGHKCSSVNYMVGVLTEYLGQHNIAQFVQNCGNIYYDAHCCGIDLRKITW